MKIRYNKQTKRLLYFKTDNTHNWDKQWNTFNIKHTSENLSKYNFIRRTTQKHLDTHDGPILEGGCGLGQFVYSLTEAGYNCVGIDTAEETIAEIKQIFPHLDVRVMDVSRLDFPDNYFAGYWSLGVIEHFLEGYEKIMCEMLRVLKQGGYLFLTVPVISPLRKVKIKLNLYPAWNNHKSAIEDFFQFAFNSVDIINDFERCGFKLVELRPYGGIKGLKDEISILKPFLQYLYDKNSFPTKMIKKMLDMMIRRFTNHMCLFVMQKTGTS